MTINYQLKAINRIKLGKNYTRALRNKGYIPAIIYNKDLQLNISILEKDISDSMRKINLFTTIGSISFNNKEYQVIIKDFQKHPVNNNFIHIDFLYISNNTIIHLDLPINFINKDKCIGIKQGGMLNIINHFVKISIQSKNNIPSYLIIDLSNIKLNQIISVSDINFPKNCFPLLKDQILAKISKLNIKLANEEKLTEEKINQDSKNEN